MEQDVASVEPWYPAWAPWALWPLVIAVIVVVCTEPLKWALYKGRRAPFRGAWARQKSHYAKASLLLPWKAALGAGAGLLLLPAADLVHSPVLAGALGLALGAVSFTLYDGLMRVLRYLPEVVQARLGMARDAGPAGGEDETEDS